MTNSTNKLDALYKKAESYNEEIPSELAKKIVTYTEILRVLGVYIAHATYNLGEVESARKREYALALTQEVGTGKEKEGKAELRISHYRKKINRADSDLIKWKNAYDSTKELINALKRQLDVLMMEWGKGN